MRIQQQDRRHSIPLDTTVDICVPILKRTDDLRRLLNSVPDWIDGVYVADNGPTDADRDGLYDCDYPFDLEVLELEFDVGIGRCRRAASKASDSEYIVVCDNDMELPTNLEVLIEILEDDASLGGVGGILDEYGNIRSGCCNFSENQWWGSKPALVQSIQEPPSTEWVGGHAIARFDKLANAMIVRRDALADYTWDGLMVDREHLDFFVGHWKDTDWEFAVCPEVIFRHHTGGSVDYEMQYRQGNRERQEQTLQTFKEKWGYGEVITGETRWFGTQRRPLSEQVANHIIMNLPSKYSVLLKSAVKRVIVR